MFFYTDCTQDEGVSLCYLSDVLIGEWMISSLLCKQTSDNKTALISSSNVSNTHFVLFSILVHVKVDFCCRFITKY